MTYPPMPSNHAGQSISISEFNPVSVAHKAITEHGAQQDITELTVLLAYLAMVEQPQVIVELGYGSGGLSWALCQLPSRPQVLTVSMLPSGHTEESAAVAENHRVISGDTHNAIIIKRARAWTADRRADLLVIDADHTYISAYADWTDYRHLVRDGGLIAFHDIATADNYPDIQVRRLWDEIRTRYKSASLMADPSGLAGWGLLWAAYP